MRLPPLVAGTLVKRYKRFLADVRSEAQEPPDALRMPYNVPIHRDCVAGEDGHVVALVPARCNIQPRLWHVHVIG